MVILLLRRSSTRGPRLPEIWRVGKKWVSSDPRPRLAPSSLSIVPACRRCRPRRRCRFSRIFLSQRARPPVLHGSSLREETRPFRLPEPVEHRAYRPTLWPCPRNQQSHDAESHRVPSSGGTHLARAKCRRRKLERMHNTQYVSLSFSTSVSSQDSRRHSDGDDVPTTARSFVRSRHSSRLRGGVPCDAHE